MAVLSKMGSFSWWVVVFVTLAKSLVGDWGTQRLTMGGDMQVFFFPQEGALSCSYLVTLAVPNLVVPLECNRQKDCQIIFRVLPPLTKHFLWTIPDGYGVPG